MKNVIAQFQRKLKYLIKKRPFVFPRGNQFNSIKSYFLNLIKPNAGKIGLGLIGSLLLLVYVNAHLNIANIPTSQAIKSLNNTSAPPTTSNTVSNHSQTATKALAHQQSTHKTSWFGNTFGNNNKWVQIDVRSIFVTPDGTVYTNSPWDEAGREAGIYKNGDVVSMAKDLHGWGRMGGLAVTADRNYLYLAMQQFFEAHPDAKEGYPPKGTDWHCVRRYTLKGEPAPFEGGQGHDKSMVIVSTANEVTGLAIAGDFLFASEGDSNVVHVYNKATMKPVRKFNMANPGAIAVDKQNTLWIIQTKKGSKQGKVLHYSRDGKILSGAITDVVDPTAVAIDKQGRLLVADNGVRQQVFIYNLGSKPKQVVTLGVKNGVYAGVAGQIQDQKFYGISGLGTDNQGNIYVSNNGFNRSGVDLRAFTPTGKIKWRLLGLHFIDNADADPANDGATVFTKQERFAMDYSKPAGQQATYKALTVNAFKYPQDPRLHTAPNATIIRRIQGKLLMYLMDMYGGSVQIYRFNPKTDGEIAIPSGFIVGTNPYEGKAAFPEQTWPPNQPPKGEWIWRDRNGNGKFDPGEYDQTQDYPYIGGWSIDSRGDIWKTVRTPENGIRHFPFLGFDKHGNPMYSYAKMEKQSHPSAIADLRRIEYFPETDTMYLSGFTKENPAIGSDYAKDIGSEIFRIDNWSKGNRNPRWRIVLPVDKRNLPEVLTPVAMDVERDRIFVTSSKTWDLYVYDAGTGKLLRTLKPGQEVSGELGWVDIAYGVRAFKRKNGDFLVFLEEVLKGKVIMYQVPGSILK